MNDIDDPDPSTVSFYYNERILRSIEGIPVSVALYSNGILPLYKSVKYGRPRGSLFFSWYGEERININDDPLVNPSIATVKNGIKVRGPPEGSSQSLLRKVFSNFLEAGFQHKFIIRAFWPITRRIIERSLPYPALTMSGEPKFKPPERIECDILVVGGGLAGLVTSIEIAKLGMRVIVVEGEEVMGGHLAFNESVIDGLGKRGSEVVRSLTEEALKLGVKFLKGTIMTSFLEDATFAYDIRKGIIFLIKFKSLILATGARELPCLFENNDLPGILSAYGALKLLNYYNVRLGSRGAVIGSTPLACQVSEQLVKKGIEVTMIDPSEFDCGEKVKELEGLGVNIMPRAKIVKAKGRNRVKSIIVESEGSKKEISVDFIVMASYRSPSIELAGQIKLDLGFHSALGGVVPIHNWFGETSKKGVFVTGEVGGVIPESSIFKLARATGLKAAEFAGAEIDHNMVKELINESKVELMKDKGVYDALKILTEAWEKRSGVWIWDGIPLFHGGADSYKFICRCLDVTVNDLKKSYEKLGTVRLERIKRFTGLGTGRCQGKSCMVLAIAVLKTISGEDLKKIGFFRYRAPVIPVKFEDLGGVADEF